jgi:CRISPR-associated protein Csb1
MTDPKSAAGQELDRWAEEDSEVVALYLRQRLLPVEGADGVLFPPTYADIGYNIDELADGTRVATIDSVGSQANRMEPIFMREPYSDLVPQISIRLGENSRRSLLELAHRAADATVYACPGLAQDVREAFSDLASGDAWKLCCLAPTSLIFGVWDSREGGLKRPRLVRSIIRASGAQVFHAAAQFNSIWKALGRDQQAELEAAAKAARTKLSDHGLADAPATFRKLGPGAARGIPEYRDGSPNPARRTLGGITAERITREVTVNLAALRSVPSRPDRRRPLRRYLLALSMLAATADQDLFLREGCNLRIADEEAWVAVPRRGEPMTAGKFDTGGLLAYARAAAEPIRGGWPSETEFRFEMKEAKKLLKRNVAEESAAAAAAE